MKRESMKGEKRKKRVEIKQRSETAKKDKNQEETKNTELAYERKRGEESDIRLPSTSTWIPLMVILISKNESNCREMLVDPTLHILKKTNKISNQY